MLIRPCYKIMKAINYLCKEEKMTTRLDIITYFHNRVNHLDLKSSIDQLAKDGFITFQTIDGIEYIVPEYKGKHYSEYRWLATKEVLLKSFLLPIAVAFVTTLLTLAANGYLSSIQQYLTAKP